MPFWSIGHVFSLPRVWCSRSVSARHTRNGLETLGSPANRAQRSRGSGGRVPDGQLARFYELETNKPRDMFQDGDVYSLTYDNSDLPTHYGFKTSSKIDKVKQFYEILARVDAPKKGVSSLKTLRKGGRAVFKLLSSRCLLRSPSGRVEPKRGEGDRAEPSPR